MVKAKPDCTGQRLGLFTVLGKGEVEKKSGKSRRLWILRCDCGKVVKRPRGDFDRKGYFPSCGCRRKLGLVDNKRRPLDITDKRFGNLTAIKLTGSKDKRGQPTWLCKCDCGSEIALPHKTLNNRDSAKNCRADDCPYYRLQYPPTPEPYPKEAGELMIKYLHLTKNSRFKNNKQCVEDERVDRLIRACWILVYRRSQGEIFSELKEARYISKCLAFAPVDVYRQKRTELYGGMYYNCSGRKIEIGIQMTNVTPESYPVIKTRGTKFLPKNNPKRFKFKRK